MNLNGVNSLSNPQAVFEGNANSTMQQLFDACHFILTQYKTRQDELSWMNHVDSGRLFDALRLYIGLSPAGREIIANKRYRAEHGNFFPLC
jgi:hypothetical protein